MKAELLHEHDGLRVFAVVLATGEEVVRNLTLFANDERLAASQFTAIGAFQRAVVAYFDWESKRYLPIPIGEQVEVLSLIGDITIDDRSPKIHAHVVVGTRDGSAHGGHLLEGHVRPTLEVLVTELPRHLHRKHDAASGLALIDLRS